MNKEDFLSELKRQLHFLSQEEIMDILSDYEEHFNIGLTKGKSEFEISQELGDPFNIAKDYRSADSKKINGRDSNNRDLKGNNILMGLLLIGFNLIFVLGPLMAVFGVIMAILGVAFGLIFGGFYLYFTGLHFITAFFFNLFFFSVGSLALMAFIFLIKLFIDSCIKYLKWNLSVINKGGF